MSPPPFRSQKKKKKRKNRLFLLALGEERVWGKTRSGLWEGTETASQPHQQAPDVQLYTSTTSAIAATPLHPDPLRSPAPRRETRRSVLAASCAHTVRSERERKRERRRERVCVIEREGEREGERVVFSDIIETPTTYCRLLFSSRRRPLLSCAPGF